MSQALGWALGYSRNTSMSLPLGWGQENKNATPCYRHRTHTHVHPDRHKEDDYREAGSLEDGESENNSLASLGILVTGHLMTGSPGLPRAVGKPGGAGKGWAKH